MSYLKNLRITTKFVLYFLLISLIPLSIFIYVSYNRSLRVLKEEVTNSLYAVADNKANQIETYCARQIKEAQALSHTPAVVSALGKLVEAFRSKETDSSAYIALVEEFKPILKYYINLFEYEDILLVNTEGNIILSSEDTKQDVSSLYEIVLSDDTRFSELARIFIKAKESQETEISDFQYDPVTKKIGAFIATPISYGRDFIGLVIVQTGNRMLYEFVRDYTGLRSTGETIIASKMADKIVFLTPLRFDPEAEFNKKIKIDSDEEPYIQKAFQKEKDIGIFMDYRAKEVLAITRYLPTFRLGMVVKMDTAEIFTSAKKLRDMLLKISIIFQAIVALIALLIAHSVSKPIKELTETAKNISAGGLSARATVHTSDEIGELAHAFNQMTDNLVESKASVEQKKAEVEEQKNLLEKANQELDSFVYTVSHDLRAPLRGIDGLINFLEEDYSDKLDVQGKDYLRKIRTSANRMKAFIDDLLTLSRISRIKNPYEDVNINELIQSVIGRIEFDIKEHNVQLTLAKYFPMIHCDKIKIEEVFLNLINNAIKFSSKNKDKPPQVIVGYRDKEDTHEFYVRDNGIGIDKKHHEEIFGIFKRLHKQEEYEGTGAGLSIVKKIIDDHKGSIWIESELGQGATFYFTIPKGL